MGAAVLPMALAIITACASPAGGAASVTLPDGSAALRWGDGQYGVVLVAGQGEEPADWGPLAEAIAANRMTALAVDTTEQAADRLGAAADWVAGHEIERAAYISSGTRGADLLVDLARSGATLDQLILITGALTDAELADLGEVPKLFAAAEGDPDGAETATHMADTAVGAWNELLLVNGTDQGLAILDGEGADELVSGVIARLEERR